VPLLLFCPKLKGDAMSGMYGGTSCVVLKRFSHGGA